MLRKHSVLVNALGVRNSGALFVLNKAIREFVSCKAYRYIVICHLCENTSEFKMKYEKYRHVDFIFVDNNSFWYRLYYENFKFLEVIDRKNVLLVYNFSGSIQFTHEVPQLVKVHNLLFFSKRLDTVYFKKRIFFTWIKQVFLKRQVLKLMMRYSRFIEIQSPHVKNGLADFMRIDNKVFYIKSDVAISQRSFSKPKEFDRLKKIKFLYIVGPHFGYVHKNFNDFTIAMLSLLDKGIDFEINITLTREQLKDSDFWCESLNSKTNFLGYINDQEKMTELFCDNTILISTSIVETLGLHVIEGIKNGVITITPNENYVNSVYGKNVFKYELFNNDSLLESIRSVINYKGLHQENILSIQDDLKRSEMSKFRSSLDVFNEVIYVQK
jgi:hypothetical protein